MDLELDQKHAVVVGASSGIGRATAIALAAESACLTLVARRPENLLEVSQIIANHHGCQPPAIFPCDITYEQSVGELAKFIGAKPIDVLVIAVGASRRALFDELRDADWYTNYELNLLGTVRTLRALIPCMAQRKTPAVVLVGAAGAKQPYPHQIVSNVHKAGLLALTKTLAGEYASQGLRINCVCPGRTMTPLWEKRLSDLSRSERRPETEIYAEFAHEIPLGRFAEPREVADMIVFLSSPRSSYVTGQAVSVDGGITRGLL